MDNKGLQQTLTSLEQLMYSKWNKKLQLDALK